MRPSVCGGIYSLTAEIFEKRIDSLLRMSVEPSEKLLRGYLVRGQSIELSVDGAGFASTGDMYLFGELLNKLYSQFADINSYVNFTLINDNTGEQLQWQPNLVSL